MDSKWEYYWPKGLLALPVIFVKLQSRSAEGLGGHWGQWAIKMQFHYLHSVRLRKWRVTSVRVASWDPFPLLHTRKGKIKMTVETARSSFDMWWAGLVISHCGWKVPVWVSYQATLGVQPKPCGEGQLLLKAGLRLVSGLLVAEQRYVKSPGTQGQRLD